MGKILLAGYYGFGNLGDELILRAMLQKWRDATVQEIFVLSANPKQTQSVYKVSAVDRWSIPQVFLALWRCDIFCCGGGGLFQDRTGFLSNFYYFSLILCAQILRKKIKIDSVGIGPIRSKISRFLTAKIFHQAESFSVRDFVSAEELKKYGVQRPIPVRCDPVLLLKLPPKTESDRTRSRCGIIVRDGPEWKTIFPVLLKTVENLLRQKNSEVVLFCLQQSQDAGALENLYAHAKESSPELAQHLTILRAQNPEELVAVIANLDALISLRLHGLILAACYGVPCLGLSIDGKIESFLQEICPKHLPIKNVVQLSSISADALWQSFCSCWDHRKEYAKHLLHSVEQLAKRNEIVS